MTFRLVSKDGERIQLETLVRHQCSNVGQQVI